MTRLVGVAVVIARKNCRVDKSWIARQRHPTLQSIKEYRSHMRALVRHLGFPLDYRSERHNLMHGQAKLAGAHRPLGREYFFKAIDHRPNQIMGRGLDAVYVG